MSDDNVFYLNRGARLTTVESVIDHQPHFRQLRHEIHAWFEGAEENGFTPDEELMLATSRAAFAAGVMAAVKDPKLIEAIEGLGYKINV